MYSHFFGDVYGVEINTNGNKVITGGEDNQMLIFNSQENCLEESILLS
jgi:hypothetical protein